MSMGLDRRIEKEDINSYIVKKREMFLVQYSLGVKRDEISKLEEIAKVIYHCYYMQMLTESMLSQS